MGFKLAATETLTGNAEFPIIMMGLEVAGLPLTHVKLDVRVQVTASPSAGE